MTARRRLTIKEVAEAAGVSTQTVSRVLNNRPDVAPETYERVQQIIADTGYAPNMLARSLTQGRSHILGVVAFGLEYFGPSRVLTGIEQQAAEMGYSISLNLIHQPETDDVDGLLNSLLGRQVDGIIWAIPEVGGNRAWSHERSPDLPVPVALVGGMAGQTSLPVDRDRQPGDRPAGDRAPAGRRGAPDRHRHRAARLVGGAGAPRRLARDARRARRSRPRTGSSSRATGARSAASSASSDCSSELPGHRRGLRQQRPDGARRPPRRPPARAGGCPRTCRSSASTTSPRRPTSGRR